jgi:membrane-associated phospholipid phosphatase
MTANEVIAPRAQDLHPHKNILTNMSIPGLLAKWPIVGLIMFIFGGLLFGGLAINLVDKGPLLQWDKAIANTLPAMALKAPAFMRGLMDAGYYIGDQVIMVLAGLLGLYLIIKRLWKELAMVVFGLVGASSLFLFLSHLFARPRPPTQIWIVLNIPGFPSGHAITVIVFYGLMAYLLAPKIRSAFWKVAVVAAVLLIIGFVGFSRVFTGGHYLTDVLAGYAVGIAWSGVVYTLIELLVQKIRSHNVRAKNRRTY